MAKHTIDIIEGVKNFSQMKLFTINNPSEENISFLVMDYIHVLK